MAELTEKEKRKIEQEKARIAKAKAQLRKELEQKEKIKGMFRNLETPGIPLEFNFQGIKTYGLRDGEIYELPAPVVQHINSLTYPEYDYEEDKETGQIKSKIKGKKQRFAFIPLGVDEGNQKKEG